MNKPNSMRANTCRLIVVETTALDDRQLSLIGQSMRDAMTKIVRALAANRQPPTTFTGVMTVDSSGQWWSLVPIASIRSPFFRYKYGDKLSALTSCRSNNSKVVGLSNDLCSSIGQTFEHIWDSLNAPDMDVKQLEVTYFTGRNPDQVMRDFGQLVANNRLDLSRLPLINIVCVEDVTKDALKIQAVNDSNKCVSNCKIPQQLEALIKIKLIDPLSENSFDTYFTGWLRELKATATSDRINSYQKRLDTNIEIMTNELNQLMSKRKELVDYLKKHNL